MKIKELLKIIGFSNVHIINENLIYEEIFFYKNYRFMIKEYYEYNIVYKLECNIDGTNFKLLDLISVNVNKKPKKYFETVIENDVIEFLNDEFKKQIRIYKIEKLLK